MHHCKSCGQDLPLTPEHFKRDARTKTGFHPTCKKCEREYRKQPVGEGQWRCKGGCSAVLDEEHEDAMRSEYSKSGWSAWCRVCYEAKHGKREEGTKRCSKCEEVKSVEEFYKHSQTRDGLYPSCKQCTNAVQNERNARKRGRVEESSD